MIGGSREVDKSVTFFVIGGFIFSWHQLSMLSVGCHQGWKWVWQLSLQWRHNGHDSVSNHQPHDCLLNRLFRCGSKKTSKLCVTGICAGNSPVTGEFPAQRSSNAENVSIWWRHHDAGTGSHNSRGCGLLKVFSSISSLWIFMISQDYIVNLRILSTFDRCPCS